MSPKSDTLSALPLDLWHNVMVFLGLPNLPKLMAVDKEFHEMFNQEAAFAHFARRKFPPETLILSSYNGSWKQLLRDDNAQNGVYVRRMHVMSEWRSNRKEGHQGRHYINSVRCMIWDRRAQQVHIGIEAYGNTDLREAAGTSIFQIQDGYRNPRHLGQRTRRTDRRPRSPDLPELERRLRVSNAIQLSRSVGRFCSRSHDLCLISLEDRWFDEPGSYYRFTYNGSLDTDGNDYGCKIFLRECSSLRHCFQRGYSSIVPGLNHCEFVSRSTYLLRPSNVLDWPDMVWEPEEEDEEEAAKNRILPPNIRKLHEEGRWGLLDDTCRSITAADIVQHTDSTSRYR